MRTITSFAIVAVAGIAFASVAPKAEAQLSISIGAAPVCPYGYYDYAPYNCSPNGYYGAQYFNNGAFIGVGPWFSGSSDFHGTVNNRFDPQHGYKGSRPNVGDKAEAPVKTAKFKGNEERDGRGNVSSAKPMR
jgi:hypothetical protein